MNKNIAVIAGDGIGPEIVAQARKVLDRVCEKYGHTFNYTDVLMGGCSIDAYGVPLTDETIRICKASDAVLMGSIGGNAATSPWYRLSPELRPEAGLLKLRKSLNLYCNLRPAYLFKELADSCPLASKEGGRNFDLVICRELTGGLYFGNRYTKEEDGVVTAVDTAVYNENEIRRIAVKAFEIAMKRGKKVCSVDKANVLDTSRLWRKVVAEVAKDYPEVELSMTYHWPGNVRELENTVHRLYITERSDVIDGDDVNGMLNESVFDDVVVDVKNEFSREKDLNFDSIMSQQEKRLIAFALKKEGTTRAAAEFLGMSQATLARKKLKYGL